MSNAKIYVEGGGNTEELRARCREGITKLLSKSGFMGRLPRIVACGSRQEAFDDFRTAHIQGKLAYVALLVDSEDPVKDIEKPWQHLTHREKEWECPTNAKDDQVFLMTTCMETWIIADSVGLKRHYNRDKPCIQESGWPPLADLESRDRHDLHEKLVHLTRNCSNRYAKGKRSFEVLGALNPKVLDNLPSFARMMRILGDKL